MENFNEKQNTVEKGPTWPFGGKMSYPPLTMTLLQPYVVGLCYPTSTMSFPTPAVTDAVSTENDDEADDAPIYDGRMEDMEDYRAVINAERFLQKLCLSLDIAVDGNFARYTDAEGDSPVADTGLFYYRTKKEMKADLKDRRSNGDLNDDQNLPNYVDQFPEPEYDYVVVSKENAKEEFGLNPEVFGEDEDEIHLPEALEDELETDDDGNIVEWYAADGEHTKADILDALNGVKGIGDKKAGKALNALQDAGIVSADL